MGAWDFGPFDNDDASDWIYELEETSDTSLIVETLAAITEADADDLETLDCTNAIAAAEIVAALGGNPYANLPDEAKAWIEENEGLDATPLVPDALTAVKRIRTNSELKDLWDESKDAAKWYASLDDLTTRLKA